MISINGQSETKQQLPEAELQSNVAINMKYETNKADKQFAQAMAVPVV